MRWLLKTYFRVHFTARRTKSFAQAQWAFSGAFMDSLDAQRERARRAGLAEGDVAVVMRTGSPSASPGVHA